VCAARKTDVSLVISVFLDALAFLLAIPAMVFALEVIAALIFPSRKISGESNGVRRQSVVILVPAHDESTGIEKTLRDLDAQLGPRDRVLVVADNCSDDTAAVARTAGAEVIERHDPTKRGKGYALEFGLNYLKQNPPAAVVIIDADCRIAHGSIDRLVA